MTNSNIQFFQLDKSLINLDSQIGDNRFQFQSQDSQSNDGLIYQDQSLLTSSHIYEYKNKHRQSPTPSPLLCKVNSPHQSPNLPIPYLNLEHIDNQSQLESYESSILFETSIDQNSTQYLEFENQVLMQEYQKMQNQFQEFVSQREHFKHKYFENKIKLKYGNVIKDPKQLYDQQIDSDFQDLMQAKLELQKLVSLAQKAGDPTYIKQLDYQLQNISQQVKEVAKNNLRLRCQYDDNDDYMRNKIKEDIIQTDKEIVNLQFKNKDYKTTIKVLDSQNINKQKIDQILKQQIENMEKISKLITQLKIKKNDEVRLGFPGTYNYSAQSNICNKSIQQIQQVYTKNPQQQIQRNYEELKQLRHSYDKNQFHNKTQKKNKSVNKTFFEPYNQSTQSRKSSQTTHYSANKSPNKNPQTFIEKLISQNYAALDKKDHTTRISTDESTSTLKNRQNQNYSRNQSVNLKEIHTRYQTNNTNNYARNHSVNHKSVNLKDQLITEYKPISINISLEHSPIENKKMYEFVASSKTSKIYETQDRKVQNFRKQNFKKNNIDKSLIIINRNQNR